MQRGTDNNFIKPASTNQKRSYKELFGCNNKNLYDWFTLLSSILLPFAITLFTIVITMQENHERDLQIAALRQKQDRYTAEQQRNETIPSGYSKDISNLILKYGHQLDDHKT